MPTVAVAGSPERSGTISDPVTLSEAVAELLAGLPSLVAPVVPVSVLEPTAVGVPETVQVILAPAITLVGGTGAHTVLRPAGSPLTAQLAAAADCVAEAALVQTNVPL